MFAYQIKTRYTFPPRNRLQVGAMMWLVLDQNITCVAFELWNVSYFRTKTTSRNYHGSFIL